MKKVSNLVCALLVACCLFWGCANTNDDFLKKHYEDIVLGQTRFDEVFEKLGEHDYDSKLKDNNGAITWTSKNKEQSIYVVFENGIAVQKHAVGFENI